MKSARYTPEQVAFGLRRAEYGTSASEACHTMGISEQSFYRRKKQLHGVEVAEVGRLRALEEENCRLRRLVADLSLDKQIL